MFSALLVTAGSVSHIRAGVLLAISVPTPDTPLGVVAILLAVTTGSAIVVNLLVNIRFRRQFEETTDLTRSATEELYRLEKELSAWQHIDEALRTITRQIADLVSSQVRVEQALSDEREDVRQIIMRMSDTLTDLRASAGRGQSGDSTDKDSEPNSELLLTRQNPLRIYKTVGREFAHSIKSPLSAAENSLALVRSDVESILSAARVAEPLAASVQADLLRLGRAITQMRKIVTDHPLLVDRVKEFDLREVVDTARGMAEEATRRKPAFRLNAPAHYRVTFHELALLVALLVLLENAIEASDNHGEVTVEVKRADSNGRTEVLVSNTGRPVPESVEQTLFQPIESAKGEGHGMGLVLARNVMRRFGGDVAYRGLIHGRVTFELCI